jgi:hypothetical protein
MRYFFAGFVGGKICFMLFCSTLAPLSMQLNINTKVKFINKNNTKGVTVMHLTRSFDENLDDIFKSRNCGKLHYDVVNRLETPECDLKFKLEILRVGDCFIFAS